MGMYSLPMPDPTAHNNRTQVDPRKRFSIDEVVTHAFLKGGSTATMDEEVLSVRAVHGSCA